MTVGRKKKVVRSGNERSQKKAVKTNINKCWEAQSAKIGCRRRQHGTGLTGLQRKNSCAVAHGGHKDGFEGTPQKSQRLVRGVGLPVGGVAGGVNGAKKVPQADCQPLVKAETLGG